MSSLAQKGAGVAKNAVFTLFLKRAAKLVGRPGRIALLLTEAVSKLKDEDDPRSGIHQVIDLGQTLVRFVRAWASGHYRGVSPMTVVGATAVLLYVVSPLDIVPDFIPLVGFGDDLALIAWFVKRSRNELTKFERWEAAGGQPDALVS